jgi:hypothetical protein
MKKLCRVYKKKSLSQGGSAFSKDQLTTQDSGNQDVLGEKKNNFLNSIKQNVDNYNFDEGPADALEIVNSLSKDIPEFKTGGVKNWIQKARKGMKRKGTVGKFTEYCGGKVTADCIERGLNSPDPKVRKRAGFAKAMRTVASQNKWGGAVMQQDPNLPMARGGVSLHYNTISPGRQAMYDYYNTRKGQRVFDKGMRDLAYNWMNRLGHTRYKLKDTEQIFDDPKLLSSFKVTGYTPGKGDKHAYLDYEATGINPVGKYDANKPFTPNPNINAIMQAVNPDYKPEGKYGYQYTHGGSHSNFNEEDDEFTYQDEAQKELDYRDWAKTIEPVELRPPKPIQTSFDKRTPMENLAGTTTKKGRLELDKVGFLEGMFGNKNLGRAFGLEMGKNFITNVGDKIKAKRDKHQFYDKRIGDVHRWYPEEQASTIGIKGDWTPPQFVGADYQPNAPEFAVGFEEEAFAQMGYEVGDELELSPEEIETLINQGYQLDFID